MIRGWAIHDLQNLASSSSLRLQTFGTASARQAATVRLEPRAHPKTSVWFWGDAHNQVVSIHDLQNLVDQLQFYRRNPPHYFLLNITAAAVSNRKG